MIDMINDQVYTARKEAFDKVKRNAKRMVWVTFQREGIHMYPQAASDPALEEVKFLSYPHRHIFHFRIDIEVFHDDRDIEFILFKRWCENLFDNNILQLNHKSCEMLCDSLFDRISQTYPDRDIIISVSEDNENGAKIYYNKP